MKCNICGSDNSNDAKFCEVCGSQLQVNKDIINVNSTQDNIYAQNKNTDSKMATIAMILGIISISTGATCCLFLVAVLTGIPAIILAIIALVKNTNNSGKAIAGLITGLIGLLWGGYLLLSVYSVLSNPEMMEEIRRQIDEAMKQNVRIFTNYFIK